MQNYKCKAHTTRLLHLLNYPVFKNFYKQYNVFSFTYFIEPAQLVVLLRKRAWATGEAASSLNMNSGRFFSVCFSFVVREVRATPANPRRSRKWGGTGRRKEDLLHLPLPHLFSRLPFAQRSLNTAPPAPTKKKEEGERKDTTPATQNVVSALSSSQLRVRSGSLCPRLHLGFNGSCSEKIA